MTELEKAQLRNVDADTDTDTKLAQLGSIAPSEVRKRVADEVGLSEMMRECLRLGRRALGLAVQHFGGAAVQRLAAALE